MGVLYAHLKMYMNNREICDTDCGRWAQKGKHLCAFCEKEGDNSQSDICGYCRQYGKRICGICVTLETARQAGVVLETI